MTTVARIRLSVLIVLLLGALLSACNSQPAAPPTTAAQPSISDPMISDPTPQEPGKEVGISVDVSSAGGVTLTYTWNADGGEIVRGQGSPAITYRVPEEPGTYNVRVKVEWDGQSVEKVTTIQVKDTTVTPQPTNPSPSPTPTLPPPTTLPTNTPTPSPTATPRVEEPSPAPTQVTVSAPTLILPEKGKTYQNPITFQWEGSLSAGQTYLARVWHAESGHSLQSPPLSASRWTANLPAEKFGDWRWSVSVMQGGSSLVTSDEGMFWFNPFPGSGDGNGDSKEGDNGNNEDNNDDDDGYP